MLRGRITFGSVANHAGVSRSWLYNQPDLTEKIRRLRTQNRTMRPGTVTPERRASEESWHRRLELAHTRIKELNEEIRSLRTQLALAHGQRRADNTATLGERRNRQH
ncbi:DUF6262 family protein [Nocardia jinanensis]|uniref:DUF6262 family protein n=1 Tax=Nocardia jinanensis TaxID=382504 RepID=UPI0007A4ABF7|nr:DUF6262 family protein [Nocardia jinanensis]